MTETVRLGMGLVGTMAALVLGLLIASAKGFYDTQSSELTELSAKVVLLDRILAHYGPETKEIRDLLHSAVARTLDMLLIEGPSPTSPNGTHTFSRAIADLQRSTAQRLRASWTVAGRNATSRKFFPFLS